MRGGNDGPIVIGESGANNDQDDESGLAQIAI
jgi:hypothetical protein